jgi:hypothetical protein
MYAVMAKYRVVFPPSMHGDYSGLHAFAFKYQALQFLKRARRGGIDVSRAELHPPELARYVKARMR